MTGTELTAAMALALERVKACETDEVLLFHHNDTDGLTSGTILLNAFRSSGYRVSRYSLEKPYPQVLERILSGKGKLVVFADFAGKIAPMIAEMNSGRNLVIILDHHPAEPTADPSVFNLDGDLYGLKGDRDISASATCQLFADLLLRESGRTAEETAHLGVLGAIGDGFLVNGALSGINREIMKEAAGIGTIRVEKTDSGEKYFVTLGDTEHPALAVCDILDTLGGAGYYSGGTDTGIELCSHGLTAVIAETAEKLKEKRDMIFREEIRLLPERIRSTENIQWFDAGDRFRPMGVKMIGVFCNMIRNSDFLDRTRYLAGFQAVPDEIPGFGEIRFNATKISMRVSDYLTENIRAGLKPGLSSFLPEATARLGGFSDACHSLSAATTVRPGQQELLINEMEDVLKSIKGE